MKIHWSSFAHNLVWHSEFLKGSSLYLGGYLKIKNEIDVSQNFPSLESLQVDNFNQLLGISTTMRQWIKLSIPSCINQEMKYVWVLSNEWWCIDAPKCSHDYKWRIMYCAELMIISETRNCSYIHNLDRVTQLLNINQ